MNKYFKEQLVEDICHYIDALKKDHDIYISLHRLESALPLTWHRFLAYNIHNNSYCFQIKSNDNAWARCIQNQDCIMKLISKSFEPFDGVCWAGLRETVIPIKTVQNRGVAFMSISGYQTDKSEAMQRMYYAVEKYGLDIAELEKAYATLKVQMPEIQDVLALITPLLHMFTLLILEQASTNSEGSRSDQYVEIVDYIRRNFSSNISLSDLASKFHYTYTSISKMLGKKGTSFTTLLQDIRFDAAKKYLQFTDENITSIAMYVGFQDANYFSTAFTKSIGMNPTEWRSYSRSIANT